MLDWKIKQEKIGKTFPGGLHDVMKDPQCNENWKSLSSQERGLYVAKAKKSKIENQKTAHKKTTIGENIEEIMANEKKEQEFQQNMSQYIDSIISLGIQHKNLEKLKFIFIHVNWFYKREIGINKYDFCPAEFAVAEFSLGNGIENVYSEIINANIPLGWKRDAIETSQESHKININMSDGQSDFAFMYNKFVEILKSNMSGNKFPPLFTTKDVTLAVESLLNRMTEATNTSMNDFVIYSLENLFGVLRNVAAQNVNDYSIPLVVAENEFRKDFFSSVCNLGCAYHNNIDNSSQFCSMSIVKRWGFTVCDYCCEFLNIPMVEGVHYPMSQLPFNCTDKDSIDYQMNKFSITNKAQTISMTGVSENHRKNVSERTYKDEQRRRENSKALEIIDHSKINSLLCNLPVRPLRTPRTTPRVLCEDVNNSNFVNNMPSCSTLKDADFPPLGGRGTYLRKAETKLPLKKGRGEC